MEKIKLNSDEEEIVNQIMVGDIVLSSSKNSMKSLIKDANKIIKNKHFRDYLDNDYSKKKLLGMTK